MVHKGEIIEQVVRKSGIPITTIAKRLGKSRRWMYLMFENPDVPIEIIQRIGQITYHDFSNDFQMPSVKSQVYEDDKTHYETANAAYWKDKYFRLLEEYNELLKKISLP